METLPEIRPGTLKFCHNSKNFREDHKSHGLAMKTPLRGVCYTKIGYFLQVTVVIVIL